MFKLLFFRIIIIFALAKLIEPNDLPECNVKFEYERLCHCKTRYSRFEELGLNILPPESSYIYCDNDDLKYHECYKADCLPECEKSIRDMNFINKTDFITQESGNNICNWAVGNMPITETGLKVVMEANPGECVPEYKVLAVDICCHRRCTCKIRLLNSDVDSSKNTIDLTHLIPPKEVYYSCASNTEFGECENDCRSVAADYLGEPMLRDKSLNYVNLLDSNSTLADNFCSQVDESVVSPGSNPRLIISTMPGDMSLYKEIFLGTMCCNRPCSCQFVDKTGQNVLDLSGYLSNKVHKHFECSSQHFDCKKECLDYVGDDFFQVPNAGQSSYDTQVNYFNYFEQKKQVDSIGSNKLCSALNKEVLRPGKDIILRIESAQSNSNVVENLSFGKMCCKRPCQCDLVAKNYITNELGVFQTVNYNARLIANLNPLLPERNASYDCSLESYNCIRDCKIAAGIFLKSDKLMNPDATIATLDIFFDFPSANKICQTVSRKIESPGMDIFVRYDTGSREQGSYEDLHVGRICCNEFYFPANKCMYPFLPTINGTLFVA